jgi:Holliday junction resolvase
LDAAELDALGYLADNFGVEPRIGIRFDERKWASFDPGALYRESTGNYRVKLETAIAEGEDIHELAGELEQVRLSDSVIA